jgi:hypothetical protein
MGFQLVIAEGKEAGREFVFDQDSVMIGRTTECDVVLYDSGVSRKHVRIFLEAGIYSAEDQGSSNGTKVNGTLVKKQALNDGDTITLGPVVFTFKALAHLDDEPPTGESPAIGDDAGNHTRVISAAEIQRSRNRGVAMVPKNVARGALAELNQRQTSMLPVLKGPRPSSNSGIRASSGSGIRPSNPERRALAKREAELPTGVEVAGGGGPRLARRNSAPPLSASEKSRLKRDGAAGGLKLFWAEASAAKRAVASVLIGAVSLGLLAGLFIALKPEGEKPKPKEPDRLTMEPVEYRFGLGEDVMFERPDLKSFDFDVASPVQVMVVIQYQSKNINARDEVAVSVNGVDLGFLVPDTDRVEERTNELIIPSTVVKRNETNTITFDNVRNPPDQDPWEIWNLWIEIAVLPEKDTDGLIVDAEDKFKKGRLKWEQVDLGSQNGWDAYKYFREAWLTLEAVPAIRRPATYELARNKMKEAREALDKKCKQLLMDATKEYNFKNWEAAGLKLEHVSEYFPSKAHPCRGQADRLRYEFDL